MASARELVLREVVPAILARIAPGPALRSAWRDELIGPAPVHVIAAGKASEAMAREASARLGARCAGGIVCLPGAAGGGGRPALPASFRIFACEHPLPARTNERAAAAAERLAAGASEAEVVLLLLSGGASAHLSLPAPGVTIDDLRLVTDACLRSGARISELNTIRKHLERLKGGQLAAVARARVVAYVLSDIPGHPPPLDLIASGPSVPDPSTRAEASVLLHRFVPAELASRLDACLVETPKALGGRVEPPVVIASNSDACAAARDAAESLGMRAEVIDDRASGEARAHGERVASWLAGAHEGACAVWGGETVVAGVPPGARGGRNLEAALACAIAIRGLGGARALFLATDGRDGSSGRAGAVVDDRSAERMSRAGVDPVMSLAAHASERALTASGDALALDPTGTNAADVTVAWRERA